MVFFFLQRHGCRGRTNPWCRFFTEFQRLADEDRVPLFPAPRAAAAAADEPEGYNVDRIACGARVCVSSQRPP